MRLFCVVRVLLSFRFFMFEVTGEAGGLNLGFQAWRYVSRSFFLRMCVGLEGLRFHGGRWGGGLFDARTRYNQFFDTCTSPL